MARSMASVRAAFHRKQEIERRQVAVRLLEETEPGSVVKKALSISEGGTTAMRSSAARLVRKEQLKSLLDQHCSPHLPGTHPFFRGLCALLLLQCEAAGKSGGAGKHRLEWEVDVAVFTEAGGRDWLKQTIVILVGVLGMQQHIKGEMSLAHPRHEDEVPDLDEPVSLRKKGEVPPRVPPHRVLRRQSEGDPFGDPAPARAPLTTALPLEPLEPSPEPQTRVFTMAPYITDPELASLATLFPDFITKAVKGHRLGHSAQEVTPSDLESGFNARASVISHDSDAASVRSRAFAKPGHGAIVLSRSTRDEGWHGGVVERLVWFLKRVLHMS